MKIERRYYSWRLITKNFQFVWWGSRKERVKRGNVGPYVPSGYHVVLASAFLWVLRRDSNAPAR